MPSFSSLSAWNSERFCCLPVVGAVRHAERLRERVADFARDPAVGVVAPRARSRRVPSRASSCAASSDTNDDTLLSYSYMPVWNMPVTSNASIARHR